MEHQRRINQVSHLRRLGRAHSEGAIPAGGRKDGGLAVAVLDLPSEIGALASSEGTLSRGRQPQQPSLAPQQLRRKNLVGHQALGVAAVLQKERLRMLHAQLQTPSCEV